MNILYITDFYYTVSSGAKTSARAHLNTLENLYGKSNITVIALVGTDIPIEKKEEHIIIKGTRNKLKLFIECLAGYTTYLNPAGINKIIEIIKIKEIQIVFIDNSIFGRLIKKIKKNFPDISILSYYHDVKAKLAKDWLKAAAIYKKPVMLAMLYNERLTAKLSDVNFVLGDREESLFINAYKKVPEAHLSVYMDIELTEKFHKKKNLNRYKLLFFGGYYTPNVHGIEWFVNNVFDKLDMNIDVLIAGRGMDKLRNNNYPPGVSIQGYVDNLEELYRDADIIISPIFEGGGMKVKIAEAMAYGKIIIGTDESFEGYKEKIPVEYWDFLFYRANTADEFTKCINKAVKLERKRLHYNPEIRELYEYGFSEQYAENVISKIIKRVSQEKSK